MGTPRRGLAGRVALSLLLALGMALGLPLVAWLIQPWPLPLRWVEPGTTAFMDARLRAAARAGEPLELRHAWVPLDELPPILIRAVLVAEDDRFREHRGVDWAALAEEVRYRGALPPRLGDAEDRAALRASWDWIRENRDQVRGRSTLTQQLARNLYLSPDRSFVRKGQEFLIAQRLEFFLTKERILELYLNVAEFGPGIFGVEAASQAYFNRSARELTRAQAATLAATLPHPLTSNPSHRPGRMAWRRDLILSRLGGGAAPVPPPAPEVPELPTPEIPIPATPPPEIPPDSIAGAAGPPDTLPTAPCF